MAWERVNEIRSAQGLNLIVDQWRHATNAVEVSSTDPTHAEAKFLNSTLSLRLEKVQGLWKIENNTEGGQWIGPPIDRLAPPGTVFDLPFGVLLGVTDEREIEKLFGVPDSVKASASGKVYVYNLRKIEVRLDEKGKVSAFSMKTGAPGSGVKVGSPIALWELIYGPQTASQTSSRQQLTYTAEDGKIAEVKAVLGHK